MGYLPHAEIQVNGSKLLTVQDLNYNEAGETHKYVPMRGAIMQEKVVGASEIEFSFDYEIPDTNPVLWRKFKREGTELAVMWLGAEGNTLAQCQVANVTEADPRAGGHKQTVTLAGYVKRAP